jgi:hypothetical protein
MGNPVRRLAGFLTRRLGVFKFCYLLCALAYASVVVYWGRYDMGRIHREYRLAASRIDSGYATEKGRSEVEAGCRASAGSAGQSAVDDCLRAAAPLMVQRAAAISRQLQLEKRQVVKKLVIFYGLLIVVLILLPVALVYGLLIILIFIVTGIRFDKDRPDQISTEEK